MTTSTRRERFRQLIERPPPPPPPKEVDDLVQPLRDFASVLAENAGVDADVGASVDGQRYQLTVGPKDRPAFRSIMVTVAIDQGSLLVRDTAEPWLRLRTADELEEWLKRFYALPRFQDALAVLRIQASELVDGRVERANGLATLVQITAEQQHRLAQGAPRQGALRFEFTVPKHEPLPKPDELRRFTSAGLIFDIKGATLIDRTLVLNLIGPT